MNNLSYNVGYKEYSINGDESRILRINTSDMNIITRMNKAEKELQKIADKCNSATADNAIETLSYLDNEVRKQINYVFDGDVSDIIFGNTNCISIAGGKPIFENFLEAVLPVIKEDISTEQKKIERKVSKYTSKVK